MKCLQKSPEYIEVKSTIDGAGAAGGIFIQLTLLFTLCYILWLYGFSDSEGVSVVFVFIVFGLNVISYYIMIHPTITLNLNKVVISRDGICQTLPFGRREYPKSMISKAVLFYSFTKGSRGSENTHLVELLADLAIGKTVTLFYMEKVYWDDDYDDLYNDMINTLITCGYCTGDDYQATPDQ